MNGPEKVAEKVSSFFEGGSGKGREVLTDYCINCNCELTDIDYLNMCCDCWEQWYVGASKRAKEQARRRARQEIAELDDCDDVAG